MKTKKRLLPLLILSLQATTAAGSDADSVDTSQWVCEYCPFEKGLKGTLDLGLGNVSEDSYKFGEYTGLNEKGVFLI